MPTLAALARHLRGYVAAYELWNGPNLSIEWGNKPPGPERYAARLKGTYPRIKAVDPRVIVIWAGLASTGGDGGDTALDDSTYIERMYQAGAKAYFDALG